MTGRSSTAGQWMSVVPIWTLVALAGGLLATAGAVRFYIDRMEPIQQSYLGMYLRSSIAADVGWETAESTSARELLREALYGGRFASDLFRPPLVLGVVLMLVFVAAAVPADRRRADQRRLGRRLKGAENVGARLFSRGADGISFRQVSGPAIVIPRALETSHILLAGDTGTGKSTLIGEILETVARRGETAIVYDPAMEYVTRFLRPERGDVVLNPVDARCPYWKPGDEILSDVEALTLATALFPPRPYETNTFFTESARGIFAHLLTFDPTAQQLVSWLTNEEALDHQIAGSPHAAILSRTPAQRSGILASLNLVADTLQLCPTPADSVGRWSAAEWAKERQGWVFVTSTAETRARLVPLQTLWLDSLILRMMNHPNKRQTWLAVDELSTLNKLPQLHTAVTEGRKSGLAMVIGFQGRAQMESRYGKDAETMLSQPATKIFLRASDAKAAEWASKTIGDVENERVSQSRQDGWATTGTRTYRLERHVEPLVLPSEIGGLANLTGYIKVGNRVTAMRFPYVDRPAIQPALVPRPPVARRSTQPPLVTDLV
jgi:type IV secretory pathway TraG/TraD family ATPase VirD4